MSAASLLLLLYRYRDAVCTVRKATIFRLIRKKLSRKRALCNLFLMPFLHVALKTGRINGAVKRYRRRIVRVQRMLKGWFLIKAARMEVLRRWWARLMREKYLNIDANEVQLKLRRAVKGFKFPSRSL